MPSVPKAQVAAKEEMREKKRPWSAFENAAVKSKAERLKHELRAKEAGPRARGARPSWAALTQSSRTWLHPMARGEVWAGQGSSQTLSTSLKRCQREHGCPGHLCCPHGLTADNEAKQELGHEQKAPKGT